jgi:dihydroorotase/N-acyl-D-amino-acid deacylase
MSRFVFFVLLLLVTGNSQAQTAFSILLENGMVYDGLGGPGVRTDIGIRDGRIAAIGDLSGATAPIVLDVFGLAVAPGFIDIHSHASSSDPADSPLGSRPDAPNYVRQGVTTVLGGQDGSSPIDIGHWLAYFDAIPSAINVGLFVGQGSVRAEVVGEDDRAPTEKEMGAMRSLVGKAMVDGAFGLSSGLEYTPGAFADTHELTELAAVTAPFGGLYISHVRDEGGRLMESVNEVIQIASGSGAAGQLTHHKIIGKDRWGGTTESLARVDAARQAGVDITIDVYPYTASSTSFTILFPQWAKDGGFEALVARLGEQDTLRRIRSEVIAHINSERGGDPTTIVAARCTFDPSLDGKSLADMAIDRGLPPTVENGADIAIDIVRRGNCQGVFHSMGEQDVAQVLSHPQTMLASDGGVPELGTGMPHPRNYGSFARLFAKYVRADSVLSVAQAIQKVTSLPARRLGLKDRGVLRIGGIADITVFDPETIQDHATFGNPHQYASGVQHVLVGGQPVLLNAEPTGLRPGQALRKR